MKKIISIFLVVSLILSMSVSTFATNEDFLYYGEDVMEIALDGETYRYEVQVDEAKTTVKMLNSNGELLETFTRIAGSNEVWLENANCSIRTNIMEDTTKQYGVFAADSEDYITDKISFSVADLCSAVGTAITVASFIGVFIAVMSNPLLYIVTAQTKVKAALVAAAELSLTFGGLVKDHGVTFFYRAYKTKRCRGSECFVGYYDIQFQDFETY